MNLLAKFKEFRKNGPRFSVHAKAFTPGNTVSTGLARTSPMKVAGVPVLATNAEHPTNKSPNPAEWKKVQEDFQTLCKKLDSVIALAGPVVQAENV